MYILNICIIFFIKANDPDLGINADIRYQLLNEQSQKFAIDPITGQVKAVAPFAREGGKVYGFDVKATDKKGADDGKSAIANVFVSKTIMIINKDEYSIRFKFE